MENYVNFIIAVKLNEMVFTGNQISKMTTS